MQADGASSGGGDGGLLIAAWSRGTSLESTGAPSLARPSRMTLERHFGLAFCRVGARSRLKLLLAAICFRAEYRPCAPAAQSSVASSAISLASASPARRMQRTPPRGLTLPRTQAAGMIALAVATCRRRPSAHRRGPSLAFLARSPLWVSLRHECFSRHWVLRRYS